MSSTPSVVESIKRRFSCRTFSGEPIAEDARAELSDAAASIRTGPFGSRLRFMLVAAAANDDAALKRLGTYGTIRGVTAFILGAAEPGNKSSGHVGGMYLEDFGYAMESLVLRATALGLGTCWVGGLFTRGSFSRRMAASRTERIPSVAAVGRLLDQENTREGLVRRSLGGSRRKPREELFHDGRFDAPLSHEGAGAYDIPLEMARRAPSASNRQPVRIVRSAASWHFYVRRTPGYLPKLARNLTGVEDLQRVDCGISMCHFELTARELGLSGRWVVSPPGIPTPDRLTEYSATWEG